MRARTPILAIVFLLAATAVFFADSMRSQLDVKDPSSLAPTETGAPRLSKRVLLVIIDSLPVRTGTDPGIMPKLVALAKQGASGVLWAPPNTVTTAGVRAMGVGTKPSFRDTLDLFSRKTFPQWTVFDGVVARGESVAFFGSRVWGDLLGDRQIPAASLADEKNFYSDDQAALAEASARLDAKDRSAILVYHLSRTDYFAHQLGTEREEYKKDLRAVDLELAPFLAKSFGAQTTLIVTSDHGNDRYGNHGGSGDIYRRVPVLLLGAGINPTHDFNISATQLPLVMAALLGTALPGGIDEPLPLELLALSPADQARVGIADLKRMIKLATFDQVEVAKPSAALQLATAALEHGKFSEAARVAEDSTRQLVEDVRNSSKFSFGVGLWAIALVLAIALVYLALLTPEGILFADEFFALATGLLLVLFLTPSYRTGILLTLSILEIGLTLARLGRGSRRARAGTACALAAILVISGISAARFQYSGAYVLGLARPFGFGLAILLALVVALARGKLSALLKSLGRFELVIVPVFIFAVCILQPIEVVPLLFVALVTLGLRASGVSWLRTGAAALALMLFFLVSQRIGFGLTGERIWARYAYAAALGGALVALLAIKLPRERSWLVPGALSLIALWPFGFVYFGHLTGTGPIQNILLGSSLLVALYWAWKEKIFYPCAIPLLASLFYRFLPGQASFLVALGTLIAVLGVVIFGLGHGKDQPRAKALAIAGVMFSFLFLTSAEADLPSVILLSGILLWVSDVTLDQEDPALTALLGAFVLVGVRYGLLNLYGHLSGAPYSLSNIDTHSGFITVTKEVELWSATTLVVSKMLCASVLAMALLFSGKSFRGLQHQIIAASLAIVTAFVLETSIEIALCYGPAEGKVSMAMVQIAFHASMVILLAVGYGTYRALSFKTSSQ